MENFLIILDQAGYGNLIVAILIGVMLVAWLFVIRATFALYRDYKNFIRRQQRRG